MAHVEKNSGHEEWYTPPLIVDLVKYYFESEEIDLDPASSHKANEIIGAKYYITKDQDALDPKHQWVQEHDGIKTIYNPPYTRVIVQSFAEKFIGVMKDNPHVEGIWLSNNFTETKTGSMLLENCKTVCFPTKRIKFVDENLRPQKMPLQGQMILGFGTVNPNWFRDVFGYIGHCFSYMDYPDEL